MELREKVKQIAELLKVLANENRLLLFCALMEGPMNVGEIANYVPGITRSALSQHLTLLRTHGILNCVKSGQNMIYSIADRRVIEVVQILRQYYCEGDNFYYSQK